MALSLAVPAPPPAPAASAAGWRLAFIPQRPAELPEVGVPIAASQDRGDGQTGSEPLLRLPPAKRPELLRPRPPHLRAWPWKGRSFSILVPVGVLFGGHMGLG